MITQENNQKQAFGTYAIENFKSLAAAMKIFAVTMIIISVLFSLLYLYAFFALATLRLPNASLFSLFFGGGYLGFTIYMTLELFKASNAFKNYSQTKNAQNLDLAFNALKLYWRYAGILLLTSIALGILLIAFFVGSSSPYNTAFP